MERAFAPEIAYTTKKTIQECKTALHMKNIYDPLDFEVDEDCNWIVFKGIKMGLVYKEVGKTYWHIRWARQDNTILYLRNRINSFGFLPPAYLDRFILHKLDAVRIVESK